MEQNSPTIGKRKLQARAVVNEIAQSITNGKTYEDIGRKFFPNAQYPRQTVYSMLQNPNYQDELKKLSDDFTKKDIRRVIKECLDSQNESTKLKAAEIGAKIEKMVSDHAAPSEIRVTIEKEYVSLKDATLSELQEEINKKMGLLPEAQAEVIE